MNQTLPVLALGLLVFSGCLGAAPPAALTPSALTPLEVELEQAKFDTTGPFSRLLNKGPLLPLPMERVKIRMPDGVQIASAVWRPDTTEKVPVVLMISPYFSSGLYTADTRTRDFFVEGLLSHGYAFAKVALRGSSYSTGCMESMGPNEQKDIDHVITWFGEQAWSSGSVAIIGLSYVGTTPWAGAQWGNPYLKTIVPISGVTDWFELGWRNGTSEPRSPAHMALYWGVYGVPEPVQTQEYNRMPQNLCEEAVWTAAAGPVAHATGEPGAARLAEYWKVRNYQPRVAANYNGSIFVIHGLRDWNVNIDMVVPFATNLQEQGLEVKWLLGQWGHSFPDVSRATHNRFDFAEVLKRWFDVYLKGMDLDTGPVVDVQDSHGLWRTEDTFPPQGINWTKLHLGAGSLGWDKTSPGSSQAYNPAGAVDPIECGKSVTLMPQMVPGTEWRFNLPALEKDLRISGPIRLHATVTPLHARGGEMYAELWEVKGNAWYRAGHGAMDLRFYQGGHQAQSITPGQSIVAKLEFYAADILLEKGSQVVLRVVPDVPLDPCVSLPGNGGDVIQRPFIPGQSPLPLILHWGDERSILHVPLIERDVGDGKYPGQPG